MFSMRNYLIVGVIIGIIIYFVGFFFGDSLVVWAEEQQWQAIIRNQTLIEVVVFEPFIFVMSSDPWGAVLAGLAWPAVFIWIAFIFMSLLAFAGFDVVQDVEEIS